MKRIESAMLLLLLSSMLYAATPISPVILVDNDECMMKIVAYEEDRWGFALKAQCQNKSPDKTYAFVIDEAVVNGLMETAIGYSEVAPRKKANISISLYGFMDDGIDFPYDILLAYRVSDSNDWFADPVAEGEAHVYPKGEENKAAYIRIPSADDIPLLSSDGVSATVTGITNSGKLELRVFLENNTDRTVLFSIDDASVNGFMIDPYWAKSVLPHSSAYSDVSWSQSRLEEEFIFGAEDAEFTISATDYDDWLAPEIAGNAISLAF